MDSRLIEYFLRVAELGSINRAATDLRLSQPALSRHIAQLEHQLRAKLFTRTRGGVQLTEPGTLLVERARPILRQLTSLIEQVGDRAAGQLAIGIAPSWRNLFTSNFVARLVADYPGVRLRVHEGVSHELRDVMHAGMLDLAIVPFEASPPQGYVHTPLVREPLILVSARDAGLRPDKAVPLSRLGGRKLALAGKQNVIRSTIEHAMVRRNFELDILFELDAMHLSMELARRGIADTVTPCCAVSGNAFWEDSISWSPIRGAYLTWALCENAARSHSQAVREGKRMVLGMVDEIVASRIWRGAERLSFFN
ncbi:LysR family transcriptional regulator [Burkholderia cenocepacia]|uniref:LysR family transcriptional regulator n=1 Tax=Burkholderia cenocepacia TaxID=95486 RepID=UPI000F5601FA|nr:LysR substrate-binding domain-containing protein [Burkholderia cenocepacia]RQU15164.1 LysR family transcriptional regulator [Burkholderia cenocepacia]RQU41139.1 LysR family transcriptional regulator [Burkholderia cenocepacia]RQU65480.1 LysR family transcriptional regulator [Burkholderia cenocepacia]